MAMLTVLPIIELIATAWPPQLHLAAWRFSIVGVAGATAITTLIGLFFVFVIALIAGDKGVLWLVSGVCGAAAVFCLGAAGMFPLDMLQMRSQVPPEAMMRYNAASLVALLKVIFACVTYAVLAISAYRAAASGATSASDRSPAASRLVIGQS
jgi:hypothetical protein